MDHDLEKIRRLIAKYYGVKRIEEKDGDVYVHVEDIDYYPEEYFSLLESDLRNIGLIAFTRNPDEIVIIQEHNASRRFSLKMLMALITLATLLYVGYGYVSSYFAANSIYAMYLTLLTFVIPVFAVFGSREAGRYFAMRRNNMEYSFPIFVPDPIGMGTMGTINAPTVPYPNKKSMIETAVLSVFSGFVVSLLLVMIGGYMSLMGRPTVEGIKSPILLVGSPIVFQLVMGSIIPSNGILYPVAYAGWIGVIVSSFDALPIGYLDGGLVSSALLGKNSIYLSYASIIAIIGLSILYPSWLIILVFVLIIGIRGPEPMNNVSRTKASGKALALSLMLIVLIGLIPTPFHAISPQFSVDYGQNNFIVTSSSSNVSANIMMMLNITNYGNSPITPAFSISPNLPINITSKPGPIEPLQAKSYEIRLNFTSNTPGLYNYKMEVYTATSSYAYTISLYFIELTSNLLINSSRPFIADSYVNSTARLYVQSETNRNMSLNIVSFSSLNRNYSVTVINSTETIGSLYPYFLEPGANFQIDVYSNLKQTVYVLVFNSQFKGDVAILNFGK